MLKEIDADGDLLIILTPSAGPFADESQFDAETGAQSEWKKAVMFEPWPEIPAALEDIEAEPAVAQDEAMAWPGEDELAAPPDDMGTEPEVAQDEPVAELESIEEPPPHIFQFKVSSKNMASASRFFKKMLSGVWLEATTTHVDGLRHVDMEGFDADAFTIVMYLIHGLNRKEQVPREVDVEMLARIAVVTDYLGCYDAVALASEIWLAALKPISDAAAQTYNRTTIIFLFISSVFADRTTFERCVRTAIWETSGPVPTLGLPIPGKIADAISAKREELTEAAIGELYFLLESLRGNSKPETSWPRCNNRACQCMRLGSLMLSMEEIGLSPRPQRPYMGRSLKALVESMEAIETPTWHESRHKVHHPCNIRDDLSGIIKTFQNSSPSGFGHMFPTHPLLNI